MKLSRTAAGAAFALTWLGTGLFAQSPGGGQSGGGNTGLTNPNPPGMS